MTDVFDPNNRSEPEVTRVGPSSVDSPTVPDHSVPVDPATFVRTDTRVVESPYPVNEAEAARINGPDDGDNVDTRFPDITSRDAGERMTEAEWERRNATRFSTGQVGVSVPDYRPDDMAGRPEFDSDEERNTAVRTNHLAVDADNSWMHTIVETRFDVDGVHVDLLVWNTDTGATFRCGSIEDANATIEDRFPRTVTIDA